MVEGTAFETRQGGNSFVSSNLTVSAKVEAKRKLCGDEQAWVSLRVRFEASLSIFYELWRNKISNEGTETVSFKSHRLRLRFAGANLRRDTVR